MSGWVSERVSANSTSSSSTGPDWVPFMHMLTCRGFTRVLVAGEVVVVVAVVINKYI